MTHLENDPLKLAHRGRLGHQAPPDRGVPRRATTCRSRTRASRCSTSRTTTSPRSRSLYYLLERRGAGRAHRHRRRDHRSDQHAAADHAGAAARRVHQAGQGTQARLHGRLGAPEAQRPGAAHGALQGPVQVARRAGRALDRLALALPARCRRSAPASRRRGCSRRGPGLQRVLEVDLGRRDPSARTCSRSSPAPVALGDRVVVNTTAVELGLGTGGWHVVHWNLERDEWQRAGPGSHASSSATRASRPTSAAPRSTARRSPTSSRSTACRSSRPRCTASSPAVAVAFKHVRARRAPRLRDDRRRRAAARDLRPRRRRSARRGLIDATVTCGHAFGGDYEAVSVLLGARGGAPRRRRRRRGRRHGARHRRHRRPGSASRGIEVGPSSTPRAGSAACRSRACASRSPTCASATAASRTTRSPRSRVACRSRVLRRVAGGRRRRGGAPARRPRGAGIDRRHDIVDVAPPDVLDAVRTRTASTSCRWAARPPSTRPVPAAAAAGTLAAHRVTTRASSDAPSYRDATRPRRADAEPARVPARHAPPLTRDELVARSRVPARGRGVPPCVRARQGRGPGLHRDAGALDQRAHALADVRAGRHPQPRLTACRADVAKGDPSEH